MYHKQAIESSPLQAYSSALLFSPQQSSTRTLFQHEEPTEITVKPPMGDDWSACLQTLEGHSDFVWFVTFSRDSTRLASASGDGTAKIWDANSGACLQTLDVDTDFSWPAFSLDMTRMVSSSDQDVKIWDTSNGACLQTLTGHDKKVVSVAFSHDSNWVASAVWGNTIKIWDVNSGTCLQTLTSHMHVNPKSTIAFSHDSTRLVVSGDNDFMICDTSNGACLQTLTGHDKNVVSVAFSHDSKWVALAAWGNTIKIWDVNSGTCLQTLDGYSGEITSVIFSHDSNCLASASDEGTVKIWDRDSGACLYTLEGHSSQVSSIAFSYDSNWLASASDDNTIKIWDLGSGASSKTPKDHSHKVRSITFSHDFTQMASASSDKTVKIWDTNSGLCVRTFGGHSSEVDLVVFSRNSARLASTSSDGIIKIWDVGSSTCIQTIRGSNSWIRPVVFSSDSTRLASASLLDGIVQIWDTTSGDCLQELLLDDSHNTLAGDFSHDLNKLASTFSTYTFPSSTPSNSLAAWSLTRQREFNYFIKIWDMGNGSCLQTMDSQNKSAHSIAFSHDSSRLAAAYSESIVKIFDANSGVCLQTLKVDRRITTLSFDSTGSYLHTDVGTIAIDSSETSSLVDLAEPKHCQWLGVGISSNRMWITNGGENILRIPPEYRANCSSVGGNMVGIGTGSGKVWICSVNLPSASICREANGREQLVRFFGSVLPVFPIPQRDSGPHLPYRYTVARTVTRKWQHSD
jgi:WD40 repeat protein